MRQRLKGHILASYYPPKVNVMRQMRQDYKDCTIEDAAQEARLEVVEAAKARGKGAPKKRTKEGKPMDLLYRPQLFGRTDTSAQSRRSSRRGNDEKPGGLRYTHVHVQHLHWTRRYIHIYLMYEYFTTQYGASLSPPAIPVKFSIGPKASACWESRER